MTITHQTLTPKRVEKFEVAARHLDIPSSRTLALDYNTRWNSTYLMLEVAIIYKDVFRRLKQQDAQYKSVLTERDWDLASNICKKLKYELNKWRHEEDDVISDMAEQMILKFDKYWPDIHGLMGIRQMLETMLMVLGQLLILMKVMVEDETSGITSEDTTKLDHYLKKRVCNPNMKLDILAWWKINGLKYPTLQKIARDILAIPISTVALESYFSISGRLITPHRSRLKPKYIKSFNVLSKLVSE
ncbi:zinc finger BED domain-containing protein RICESLEEPER 2-like protein [Tanacetum coccineum]